jgi:hypothetical protein
VIILRILLVTLALAFTGYAQGSSGNIEGQFIVIVSNESTTTGLTRADLRRAFLNKLKTKQPVSVYKKEDPKKKELATRFLQFALKDDQTTAGEYKVEQIKKKIKYSGNVTKFVKDWDSMINKVATDKACVGFLPKSYASKLPKGVKICKVE